MITEHGRIVDVGQAHVWVETEQQSSCGRCAVRSGCGQGLLNRFASQPMKIQATVPQTLANGFKKGDWIELGIADQAVLVSSLVMYGVPLAGLLLGSAGMSGFGDLAACAGAILGALLGRRFAREWLERFYTPDYFIPVVLGKVASEGNSGVESDKLDVVKI